MRLAQATLTFTTRLALHTRGTGRGVDKIDQMWLSLMLSWMEKKLVLYCCCPSIILAIVGPWMYVLGGVFVQKTITQPLTDYVWLGGDPFDSIQQVFAAQLFIALESAIKILSTHWTGSTELDYQGDSLPLHHWMRSRENQVHVLVSPCQWLPIQAPVQGKKARWRKHAREQDGSRLPSLPTACQEAQGPTIVRGRVPGVGLEERGVASQWLEGAPSYHCGLAMFGNSEVSLSHFLCCLFAL